MTEIFSDVIINKAPEIVTTTLYKYQQTVVSSILTATILLISLSWTDVIKSTMEYYFPNSKSIEGKIYYACVITMIVLILQLYLFPMTGFKLNHNPDLSSII
jgi:TRAP-type C4-dicarboxylate transport system permease small subunit